MVKTSFGKEKLALSCLKQATIVDAESQVKIAELLKLNSNFFSRRRFFLEFLMERDLWRSWFKGGQICHFHVKLFMVLTPDM